MRASKTIANPKRNSKFKTLWMAKKEDIKEVSSESSNSISEETKKKYSDKKKVIKSFKTGFSN